MANMIRKKLRESNSTSFNSHECSMLVIVWSIVNNLLVRILLDIFSSFFFVRVSNQVPHMHHANPMIQPTIESKVCVQKEQIRRF